MKNHTQCTLVAIALLCWVVVSCNTATDKAKTAENSTVALSDSALAKRGEYLVGVMGCQDCHSPKKMGAHGPEVIAELHLSGYPANRPVGKYIPEAIQNGWMLFGGDGTLSIGAWGASFAANITSDSTGIGTWTYEQFKIALTQGKSKGIATARPLLPPMPWPNYVNMAEEDMKAVFAYLKSTKPVKNVVPAPIPPDKL